MRVIRRVEGCVCVQCVCVMRRSYLVGEAQIADADGDLPDVIPHIGHTVIRSEAQRPIQAGQRHVVLRRVEAA